MTAFDPIDTASGRRARSGGSRRRMRLIWRRLMGTDISGARLSQQIRDFVAGSRAMFWQRQGMYAGSCLLAAFYYDMLLAGLFFALLQGTEFLDCRVSKRVIRELPAGRERALQMEGALLLTSTLSAVTVAGFTIAVAAIEGTGQHLTPLFFLFAAGLFAAINNHQLPRVLLVRLAVYGFVFLYIPILDLLTARPPLHSVLWMQLATVIFVLFFVIECSMIFLRLYRDGLDTLDALRDERDRAREALEVKSQFVSTVSHELRTPLTAILGSLSLAQTDAFEKDPARLNEVVGIAYLNGKRLSDLINDLLDLQKIEAGQMSYDFRPVDLVQLASKAVRMIEGLARQSNVTIALDLPDTPVPVRGDEGRLAQVLSNLLSNAVKFSDGGTVTVSVEARTGKARIAIADTGIGIPPNSRDKVFGTFSQIDASDHRAYQGTGLGLNITQKIVDAHGGTVDYVSALGEGTTFTVELDLTADP